MEQIRADLETRDRRDAAVRTSRGDRARLLVAMQALEAALAAGMVRRQEAWSKRVLDALDVLIEAMREQACELASDEGLLAEIVSEAPRFERQVRQLRDQYADLMRQAGILRQHVAAATADDPQDPADLRQRLAWMLTALRHFQARESDLLVDAFNVDIGVGD